MQFRHFALAFVVFIAAPVGAVGCAQLGLTDPAKYEGVLPGEENAVRVIALAALVQSANETLEAQLDRGVLTPAQVAPIRAQVKQAERAVIAAKVAVNASSADAGDLIRVADALILAILREQAARGA